MPIGGLFDNISIDDKNNLKYKEIRMNDVITVSLRTVTPLLQMDTDGEQRKSYVNENGYSYKEPFHSANGFKGALRRMATRDLGNAVKAKDNEFKFNPENLYLYSSGAGADKKSIEKVMPKIEQAVREKAPILSLFGAGLSQIAGKTAICDIRISQNQNDGLDKYKVIERDSGNFAISNFLESHTYYRSDSLKQQDFLSDLIDQDDVNKWLEEHQKAVIRAKESKKSGESDKESTSNMQQPVTVEFIKPNTKLATSINPINYDEFSDVELGCLVKSLINLSSMQIGAAKRYGFGRLDWDVVLNGEQLFTLERDRDFTANYDMIISQKAKDIVAVYDKWLDENATAENIDIKNIVK